MGAQTVLAGLHYTSLHDSMFFTVFSSFRVKSLHSCTQMEARIEHLEDDLRETLGTPLDPSQVLTL